VEVGIVLGLLDALFLLFVAVQVGYLFGGEGVVARDAAFTYAEYARRGFFELAAVTALALPILLSAHWLLRPGSPAARRLFRLLAGLLVGLLFAVVVSALQRMRLYTAEYGLTELRLYVTAFVLWISTVLLVFVFTVLVGGGRRFAAGALLSGLVAVLLLNAANPDALIARNNIARFESGERFDAFYLTSLSSDAVPVLVEALPRIGRLPLYEDVLCETPDQCEEARGPTVERTLRDRFSGPAPDWRTYNVSRARARALVEDYPRRADSASPDTESSPERSADG
jgi:hypothetical protein